ncbi:MAG: type III-B CRISPR-associated protein Cas10/Cmr2, partial [Cyanothece sp. SIO2G6]|nr:type III-B CRISPR-associated protein Cas10/Cmr2 [Cyanothece sp. SIO2G6]
MTATSLFVRKLYALLAPTEPSARSDPHQRIYRYIIDHLPLDDNDNSVQALWEKANAIACSSDRVNLEPRTDQPLSRELRHPMSGASLQEREPDLCFSHNGTATDEIPEIVQRIVGDADLDLSEKLQRLLWWAWRFAPEQAMNASLDFLYPAHSVLPDNPIHSHNSTVSALIGAMFGNRHHSEPPQTPYLLLFTFSPVQDFIKASRKFLDFWSGSYMLHYLSARLCWRIAEEYGPDAVITPSLWGQDIIDALLVKQYPDFKAEFNGGDPVTQFVEFESSSLSTAGFPNTITALVPGKEAAIALGQTLKAELQQVWQKIAVQVKQDIKERVIEDLGHSWRGSWRMLRRQFPSSERKVYLKELLQLRQHGCWEWNGLWDAQIDNTWQPYFVAVPLGDPREPTLEILRENQAWNEAWIEAQNAIAQPIEDLPAAAERHFPQLNVGTWWGSLQTRLGRSIQAVKNTRNWSIPVSPGGRSSLSGQMSAVHPRFNYRKFKHGRGMAAGSMRLFWNLLPLVDGYKGVFDGSEQLNALELTKRLAWKHGGVAESLGLATDELAANAESEYQAAYQDDYEILIRFPNQSSIAAAHFASHHPHIVDQYWKLMRKAIANSDGFSDEAYHRFCSITHRPFQIPQADAALG